MFDKTKKALNDIDENLSQDVESLDKDIKNIVQSNDDLYLKASDWFGKHNFFSRLLILSFIIILFYSYYKQLPIPYVDTAAWLTFSAFIIISVGINSLKLIGDFILKIKGK